MNYHQTHFNHGVNGRKILCPPVHALLILLSIICDSWANHLQHHLYHIQNIQTINDIQTIGNIQTIKNIQTNQKILTINNIQKI